jgi:PAS domain S-box-containing protein
MAHAQWNRSDAAVPGTASSDDLPLSAVDWLPTGVMLVRADGTIRFANRQIEHLFGFTRAELAGERIDRILPGALGADEIQRANERTFAPRLAQGRQRDGSPRPVEIRVRSLESGGETFTLVSVTDAGDRTSSDQRSIQERSEFERLVAQLSVQFINLPAERVAGAISDALRQIGERLQLDRCSFYRVPADGTLADPAFWARPEYGPPPAPINAPQLFPWAIETMREGHVVCFSSVDEIPSPVDRENYRSFGIKSAVTVPISVAGQIVGAVGFNVLRAERHWDPDTVHRLTMIGAAFGSVLARQRNDEALRNAFAEVERLRDQVAAENVYLRREARDRFGKGQVVGQSAAVQRVMAQVSQVAQTDSTVLLLGETGTGKELFATQIHELSARRGRTMIRVNCAAIPAALIESELFGRERGAFTGALTRQAGRFELADRSTIFLDEIGDLPLEVQVKLLRVIEERQIERLGSATAIRVDTRIIAATHRDLEERIADGTFREDLFYRLNVFPIVVPPLRERTEDIPLLVWRFVDEFSKSFGKRFEAVSREDMAALQRYPWPGNIRELRNIVERAVIAARGPRLTISLPPATAAAARRSTKLVDVEKEHIRAVLENAGWRIRGADGAAERLGLRPTTLETRMAKLGLQRPKS